MNRLSPDKTKISEPVPGIFICLLDWTAVEPDPALLTEQERARIEQAGDLRVRRRRTVGRAGLRWLVSVLSGEAVERLQQAGEPAVTPEDDPNCSWQGSISHSGHWMVIAVSEKMIPGVDIEQIRTYPGKDCVSRRFFSEAEREWVAGEKISQLESDLLGDERFFRLWTRREAVVKCLRREILNTFSCFAVPAVMEVQIPVQIAVRSDMDREDKTVFMMDLPGLPSGLAGALAWYPRGSSGESQLIR